MKSLFIVFALFAAVAFAVSNSGNTYVVLVAGNSGWNSDSYATQSSMYKLYQTIKQAGITNSFIWTFFADDIANNQYNPFPGQVYNEPYVEGGSNVNVYEGIPKDFTGTSATRENFMKLFTRDGYSGYFRPTANDNVFIYLVGHKNNDGFVMPAGDNVLTGDDIYYAISNMTARRMYNKLMFFVDADHSNSLLWNGHGNYWDYFDNVYLISSTDSSHSSEGTTTYDPYIQLNLKRSWTDYFTNLLIQKGLDMTIEDLYKEIYSPYYPCQAGDSYVKNMTLGDFIHGTKSEYRTGSDPIFPHSEICNSGNCNTNSCNCYAICRRRGYDDGRCSKMCCRLSGCQKS